MHLTILNVSYSMAPVRPDSVGGAEQVLAQLDRSLVFRGHRSLVVAPEGSLISGVLLATPKINGPLGRSSGRREYRFQREAIEAALARWSIDVIHMHGIDFYEYLPEQTTVPVLVTLHLPPSWYPPEIFKCDRKTLYYHCVSTSQQSSLPPGPRLLPVIENGVESVGAFPKCRKRSYAAALGRICPEKGFHMALEAAKLAEVPLLLAGKVFSYPEHTKYFERKISPRLDPLRRFIGPVGPRKKRRMLAGAQCLLVPSLAAETSSLVAMEALAAGTPVVAFPAGALPEIIEDGRTGFIVRDVNEMAEAIAEAAFLSADECRRAARERFSQERMIGRYMDTYRHLAKHSKQAS